MLSSPMVTIRVGSSERPFYINSELLCRYSLFFRQKLRNPSPNREESVVTLREDDETSFAVFAEWLFLGEDCDTGKILKDTLSQDKENGANEGKGVERYVHDPYDFSLQFRCYKLASKLQAPGFKNQIMEEIQYHGEFCDRELPTMAQLQFVYDNFGRDDLLWRFCVRVKRWDPQFRDTYGDPGSI